MGRLWNGTTEVYNLKADFWGCGLMEYFGIPANG